MTEIRSREWAPRWALLAGTALSVLGLAASIYLAVEHTRTHPTLACPESSAINCLKVTTSSYSALAGVPVAYLGVGYFVVVTVASVLALRVPDRRLAVTRTLLATAGVAFVIYLVWAEVFGVRAICLWCTAVHLITFALFVVTLLGDALRTESPDDKEAPER